MSHPGRNLPWRPWQARINYISIMCKTSFYIIKRDLMIFNIKDLGEIGEGNNVSRNRMRRWRTAITGRREAGPERRSSAMTRARPEAAPE